VWGNSADRAKTIIEASKQVLKGSGEILTRPSDLENLERKKGRYPRGAAWGNEDHGVGDNGIGTPHRNFLFLRGKGVQGVGRSWEGRQCPGPSVSKLRALSP